MKNLQQLIDLLKSEKEKADKECDSYAKGGNVEFAFQRAGKVDAFSFALMNAQLLLLNTENEEDR